MEEVSVEKTLHFIRLNIMARRKSQNFVYIQANCGFHKSRERKFARSNYEGCFDILLSHACPKCQLLTDTDLVKSEDAILIFEQRNSSWNKSGTTLQHEYRTQLFKNVMTKYRILQKIGESWQSLLATSLATNKGGLKWRWPTQMCTT